MKLFRDRRHAGELLGAKLGDYRHQPNVVVLALGEHSIPVAYEVASHLCAPLDVFIVHPVRLPLPLQLVIGTVASGGVCIRNEGLIRQLQYSPEKLEWLFREQEEMLEIEEQVLRRGKPLLNVEGCVVILVSDGISGSSNVINAVSALRRLKPERLILATPVAPAFAWLDLHLETDAFLALFAPDPFGEVADWYDDFSGSSIQEEVELLKGWKTASQAIAV
jgi:predicted phosphoribosyltransferase